jgi:uncharacterized caspase-like protein
VKISRIRSAKPRSSNPTRFRFILHSILGLLLFAASLPAAQAPAGRGVKTVPSAKVGDYSNSWAVVIGINDYQKAPRLNYAVSDARSMLSTVSGLGFAADKTIAILDQDATKQHIEQVLYGTLRKTTPEDRVLVFFAGHGITVALPRGGDEGYLLPVDGDPDDPALTAIAMEDLRRIAKRIPAKHILFAVDACYSGFAITRDVPPNRIDNIYLEAMMKEPAVQIITAGRKGEPVLEEEGHGLFTRRLIQGMSGLADTDQNGVITVQELATWIESRVIRDSQNRQHPQYSRLDGEGQFVLVVPRAPDQEVTKAEAELKALNLEVERLRQERAQLEQQRKLQAEREALLAERATLQKPTTQLVAKTSPLTSLTITADKREIKINESLALRAHAKFADGREIEVSEDIQWSSSDANVASVDGNGKIQGRRAGRTQITARFAGVSSQNFALAVSAANEPTLVKAATVNMQEQLQGVRLSRDQGNYRAAFAILEKLQAAEPSNKDIQAELERTRKACLAEKQLGVSDLGC